MTAKRARVTVVSRSAVRTPQRCNGSDRSSESAARVSEGDSGSLAAGIICRLPRGGALSDRHAPSQPHAAPFTNRDPYLRQINLAKVSAALRVLPDPSSREALVVSLAPDERARDVHPSIPDGPQKVHRKA